MQQQQQQQLLVHSDEMEPQSQEFDDKSEQQKAKIDALEYKIEEEGVTLDVSGKSFEFPSSENKKDSMVESLYLYKNVYSLIPKSVGEHVRLKTLKFFGNEINLFAPGFGDLNGLECLQMKISPPGIGGLPLHNMKGLKELQLSKTPPRPSAFPILTHIATLKSLTKLSICHFSIRFLPPEIGCLKNLEYLDLSFNKIKRLPEEVTFLSGLISMKVANNKLVELPSAMASLSMLESLDLSSNRLTSLGSIELCSMHRLRNLNLQYNKLLSVFQIPSWICCNMEGNDGGGCNDDSSCYVEMDVYENSSQENDIHGPHSTSSCLLTSSSSSSRCFAARKSGKRWKRQYYLQQKARQACLNNSRKWKGVDHDQLLSKKIHRISEPENVDSLASESCRETVSDKANLDENKKIIFSEEPVNNNLIDAVNDDEVIIEKQFCAESCCTAESKNENDTSLCSLENMPTELDEASCSEIQKCISKSKRHSDRDIDNPKPCKSRKPIDNSSLLSSQYSKISFCGIEDHLSDGFYDAGRDRPFMPLENYERKQCFDSREVILLDRKKDEELDAVLLSARALVYNLKNQAAVYNLQAASLLALFVSDHFGGSDRGAIVQRTRKAVSGSNYNKPFVCTCSAGSSTDISASDKPVVNTTEDITLPMISEKSLHSIKKRRSSIVVPIGSVQFGVCRHRALLLKYLCDHMEPPVPCELVRGYLDFSPHAWNIIVIKRDGIWVRMLVDACRPHDIREEKDPEYFCRYIPLSRTEISLSCRGTPGPDQSFPSLSSCNELEKKTSTTLVRCKLGSIEAAAKVRTLEVQASSSEKIKNFEYNCLGEVRILGALKHPCIVEMYGHQISCQWTLSSDGNPEHHVLRSSIFMEYVEGGSLKNYLNMLSEAGEKHVPLDLAFCIAKDVACALLELHSKHIIHRDIKSENILFDLDKREDGIPTVKLCDFDSAVPLRSPLHACCIAHVGTPPPCVCVGTPRWMAPEVMRTMHEKNTYGLEADIWSFGCLLLEMLTLQIPYSGVSDSDVHDSLQIGKRPKLTAELEALCSVNEPTLIQSGKVEETDAEVDMLKFLVNLFGKCVEEDPTERPTAQEIHEMLLKHSPPSRTRC
ncbi:hypothetical protein Lal_00047286 [Lupinus albus]|uniref:Putative mitogen-activated protein kinase kinase kinase TKL-Pl-2 family n=1 Tax=Lupinus albus TaxID=3870 RepID=A0A6A5N8L1_LUPAL|nr:putative mitogen-activated protein kinase kinase kinase TKL-Pl-2 family [Lupinus albus]KAF1878615.1 hypothetical protein Lal_00047286 [Lupinus albus]